MPPGLTFEVWLVVIAFFLLLCVAASKVSAKLGIPSHIFFLGLGMLAGCDGPGAIALRNMNLIKALA